MIHIMTDSACDLPAAFFEKYAEHVTLLPLGIQIGDEQYEDLITIQPHDVYRHLREQRHVTTSQANPHTILAAYERAAQQGLDVIHISFSSRLSGTFNTSQMMKQQVLDLYPSFNLTIIDSRCASLGFGLIVKQAVELVQTNATYNEIVDIITTSCREMEHIFTVDDLDFLARGGRVTKASAFIGGLLQVKPILHVEDGKLIPIEKIRGRKKALHRLLDLVEQRVGTRQIARFGISHGDDEETALRIAAEAKQRFQLDDVDISLIGSAVGAHAGPGTIALFALPK